MVPELPTLRANAGAFSGDHDPANVPVQPVWDRGLAVDR